MYITYTTIMYLQSTIDDTLDLYLLGLSSFKFHPRRDYRIPMKIATTQTNYKIHIHSVIITE